jgi:hypothetical protein
MFGFEHIFALSQRLPVGKRAPLELNYCLYSIYYIGVEIQAEIHYWAFIYFLEYAKM